MTISMSSACLPVSTRMLTNLSHILAKAEQFVEAKKIDPTALTTYRLAPDMFPFTRQVLKPSCVGTTSASSRAISSPC